MKVLLFFMTSMICIACANQERLETKNWNFNSIQFGKEVFLIHTDFKYGEWGGDSYFFRLYRGANNNEAKFLLDYSEYEGGIGQAPSSPILKDGLIIDLFLGKNVLYEKKRIDVTKEYLQLISNSISELMLAKIDNQETYYPAAIRNRVLYNDQSFVIDDFPSIPWDNFQKLKTKIKE